MKYEGEVSIMRHESAQPAESGMCLACLSRSKVGATGRLAGTHLPYSLSAFPAVPRYLSIGVLQLSQRHDATHGSLAIVVM